MAFIIAAKDKPFFYPVSVSVIAENGTSRTHKFDMQFRRFSRSKLQELREETENMDASNDSLTNDAEYILRIAAGWRGVEDENGPVEFNEDNLKMLLDVAPSAAGSIVSAFFEATLGGGAARKNDR